MKPIIEIQIRRENMEAHADIEVELSKHKGGWCHIELRYASGKIMDLVTREFTDYGTKQK